MRDIEAEYQWYVQQAEDPANSPEDRELWRQLANGLAPRIGLPSPDQDELW